MTDFYGKARDLRPGMHWRHYGRGYQAREVGTVASMCNCQAPGGYTMGGTPDEAIGHQPPEGREQAKHFSVLVVTPAKQGKYPETFIMLPHADVCLTDDKW